MAKKWVGGAVLIAIGVLASFGLSFFIVEAEIYMLNPRYKVLLLASVSAIPAFIYGIGYATWYWKCKKQDSRLQDVYKNQPFWMLMLIVLEFGALFFVFSTTGLMNETSIYYFIGSLIPTVFFCCAFLGFKPF